MTTKAKRPTIRPVRTFERQAGPMPSLSRALLAATPAEPAAQPEADETAQTAVPGFLSQREVLLRLVETLKQL